MPWLCVRPERHGGQCDDADDDHQHPGDDVDPRIERLGHDELGESERHASQREHADGVGHGGDQAEQRRMAGRAPCPHEVSRDDRLAVAGRQGVGRLPEERGCEGSQDDERAQMPAADQPREAGIGNPVRGLERLAVRQGRYGIRCWSHGGVHGRCVERALQQALRVRVQLVGDAVRARAHDDLTPAEVVGVVGVADRHALAGRHDRAAQDELEPHRVQAGDAERERECVRHRLQGYAPPARARRAGRVRSGPRTPEG